MRIYVANIAYTVTQEDLESLFKKFGSVDSVTLKENQETGHLAGWAFVDMPLEPEAEKAISCLNLKDYKGKKLKVAKFRPKSQDPNRPQFGKWSPR